MALATLSIDLVAKMAKFEQDMGKAVRTSQKAADDISSAMGNVKEIFKTLAVGLTVDKLVDFAKATINSLDALNDLRDATGASIENISALEDVAARTGTSFETVQAGLIKFNKVLLDAKPGSNAEAALEAIGLKAKELKDIDPAEALRLTAVALSGFADDGNKARLSQELFGKSLKEVAPLLKDLAEQGTLVATVTTAQAQAAEDFNKQLFNFQKSATDASRALVSSLLPSIIEMNKEMEAGIRLSGGFVNAILTIGTTNPFASVEDNLKTYRAELADLEDKKSKMGRLQAMVEGENLDANIKKTKTRIAYFKELQANAALLNSIEGAKLDSHDVGSGKKALGPLPDPRKGAKAKGDTSKLTDAQSALASYVKSLESELTTLEKVSEEQKALNFLQSIGTTGQIPQVRELVLGMAAQVTALKETAEAQKIVDRAREQSSKYIESLEREAQAQEQANVSMRMHIEEIGLTKEAVTALQVARIDNAIAIEEGNAAMLRAQSGQEQEVAAIERTIELLREKRNLTQNGAIVQAAADSKSETDRASKDFADTLHSDLKGAFSAAFRDTSDPLAAFGDALANVIYTRAATALAESLASSALGSGGGGGGASALLASLFSFDGGGSTGGGARAGGLDGKGGFLAMMHPQETVLDHTKGQSAGQPVTVVQNFTVGDVASVSMVRQAVSGSERRIASAMGRSMSYGGALS